MLEKKLLEEVNEFIEDPCIEELADVQQVLDTILYKMGYDNNDLNKKMVEKAEEFMAKYPEDGNY